MNFEPDFRKLPRHPQQRVSASWQQFLATAQAQGVSFSGDAAFAESLPRVWAASSFVVQSCIQAPALLTDLIDSGDLGAAYGEYSYGERLAGVLRSVESEETLRGRLRHFRRREMVRIAWRDLAGWAGLAETLADLSALAVACIDQALLWLEARLTLELGVPWGETSGTRQGLVVIGMGKLGAGELNFSSDVDLIFAYPEEGHTRPVGLLIPQEVPHPSPPPRAEGNLAKSGLIGARGAVSNEEYFTALARRLIQVLHVPTADGFVFRVDMRLRPFGDSGPLVMGFDAMEEYYQAHGREWERYAWIKAAVVAGDRAAGARLMAALRPFVYRRYLDFSAFESLRAMKALIEAEVNRKGMADNIKLGAGGIREIEFIGQAFQLVRGGRETELQERSILTVLERLVAADYLPAYVGAELAEAYRFLRRTENRLQEHGDQQTHRLPGDSEGRERLAMAMEYGDWSDFARDLNRHRRRVQGHFEQVFAAPQTEEAVGGAAMELAQVWIGTLRGEAAQRVLAVSGFAKAEEALSQLTRFRESTGCRHLSAQGRGRLDHLMPLLIGAAGQSAYAEATLARLLGLLEKIARRTTYLSLLAENPMALSQLVRLCAASSWIAALLTRHPLLLDELLDPRSLYAPLKRAALEAELAAALARVGAEDLEQQMEALRHFQQANVLRVAAADVAGVYPLMVVSDHLTEIAEVAIDAALRLARGHLVARHGQPRCRIEGEMVEPGFAVIGYGKLGGIELGYGSDLDLVFLHGSEGEELGTQGAKPVDNNIFFARLGQRIIHMLTAHTPAGVLYEVDMRLRPSGASGMLVSSLAAFAEYQRHAAWTWEHQALVRARAVAGEPAVTERFAAVRREVLGRPRDGAQLRREVREMRERMRAELGQHQSDRFDLKQDAGGIADIEFMVQYGVLAWAHTYPELLCYTDNIRLLEALAQAGLMAARDSAVLSDIYRAYRVKVHQLTLLQEPAVVDAESFAEERAAVLRLWANLFQSGEEGAG
jgi:glutamate-ammonia-ligase adenylyltransferase